MKRLPVAAHLSDAEYKIFLQVYANHNRSMGIEERKSHTLSDIDEVVRNSRQNCLEVYFKNENWWNYSVDGSWY